MEMVTREERNKIQRQVDAWIGKGLPFRFREDIGLVRAVVMEYIANQQGLTIYNSRSVFNQEVKENE